MPKIQKFNAVFYVSIPISKMKAKKWKVGDELDASFNERGNLEYAKI
jgi:hypothetical protein